MSIKLLECIVLDHSITINEINEKMVIFTNMMKILRRTNMLN